MGSLAGIAAGFGWGGLIFRAGIVSRMSGG